METRKEPEIVYSRTIKAGKRIYYIDVKKARNEDLYVCITESKKMQRGENEQPNFEKHKLFLYKEDFAHFMEGLEDVIGYVGEQLGDIEPRQESDAPIGAAPVGAASLEPVQESPADEQPASEKRRFGFFGLRK